MNPVPVVKILDSVCSEYANAPFWYDKTNALYFVNIYQSEIHKYDPETKLHTFAKVGNKPLAFAIPIEDFNNKFIVGYGNDLAAITWDEVSDSISELRTLESVDVEPKNRISDGKVSPCGVLFVGTCGGGHFHLNNLDIGKGNLFNCPDCAIKKLIPNISIATGMTWSLTEKVFYFIDSTEYRIERYCWEKNNNELSGGCFVYEFKDDNLAGFPCGMTIDCEEHLWIACFNGGRIIRLNPRTGKIIRKIEIPYCPQITSVVFGRKNLDTLFVTTAAHGIDPSSHKNAGYIFEISGIGISGSKSVPFRLLP